MPPRHAFSNTSKIDTVYNANNRTWQGIHDSITMTKNRELFETDFIVQDEHSQVDSTRVNMQVNKHCMTELLLLDNTKVLCLFDAGSNINLILEFVIQSSEYLTSIPILDCPDYTIRNNTGEINANKFIELCFRVKDDFILYTTALVVPDFGSVKLLLSIFSMNHLNSVIDVSSRQISIRKKSFVFKTSFHNRVKAHNTMTIAIKCFLSKQLRNGNFVAKPFRPFFNYLPLNFMLQFKKRKSYLKIANPTSNGLTVKAGTTLGCVCFKLIRDLSQCLNTTTHLHQDLNCSSAMCSLNMSACPINHMLGIASDIPHSHPCHNHCNHNPQSYDYPSCAESLHISKHCHHHEYQTKPHSKEFIDNHELMMKDYYSYNQDKMSPAQIRKLKVKTFSYLSDDDVRLSMSVRNIIRKELDLDTDFVLSGNDKQSICDFFYFMCECLSTHDNPSVQNKSYMSLKPYLLMNQK